MLTEKYRVSIHARGIKKRCRKVDNHSFDEFKLEETGVNPEKYLQIAREISQTKMKTCEKLLVHFDLVETDEGDISSLFMWKPFNDRTKEMSYKVDVLASDWWAKLEANA